ncbi:serine hydrolase domain-containing protein [Sphaerisporangium flaviroseum]|uniref:Serine hydrolase domain-containing protein n=1 Tax=Sphaerisporangium flaviroseum TaxID=509199 RepID=A0ABP7J933_9ACTN
MRDDELTPASVDRFVEQYRRATGLPGVAVAVTKGERIVHAAGYGRAPSGERVTADTPMAVASVSKSFTALAVMQLVEKGKVRLDAPVRDHLPEFVMADGRAATITVRQLLNQTSGMADSTFHEKSLPQPDSLREAVARLRPARLATAPGTHWSYHNTNFQVAARLVEVVGGEPFAAYMKAHVFAPLGMRHSVTVDTERDLPPSARGHLYILGRPVPLPEPHGFGNGSGGVISSAADLTHWMIAQNDQGRGLGGVRVVSARSIAEMRTPSSAGRSYALGWSLGSTPNGAPVVKHGGDLFTSTAEVVLLPETGYGIAVMAGTGLAFDDAGAIADALVAMAEGRRPVSPPAVSPFLLIDVTLAVATAVTLVLAALGLARSRRWAVRRTGRSRWGTASRLALYVLPAALCATAAPIFRVLSRGRDIAWIQLFYIYPTFMIWLVTATLLTIAVLATRTFHLVRPRTEGDAQAFR